MNERTMPLFDTHQAVKALCQAGFGDAQAEAVVDQISGAVNDNVATKYDLAGLASAEQLSEIKVELREAMTSLATLATKEDLHPLATKEELRPLATKEELRPLATKEELRPLATKEELRPLATKEDLRPLATKEELRRFATKEDLAQLEIRMLTKMDELTSKLLKYMGGGIAVVVALIKGLDVVIG